MVDGHVRAGARSRARDCVVDPVAGVVGAIPFAELERTTSHDVTRAFANVGPDTVARFLFTSGSTGSPKAVINTQRMLTSNQAAKAQTWPFLDRAPPVVLDWLPWSHTF